MSGFGGVKLPGVIGSLFQARRALPATDGPQDPRGSGAARLDLNTQLPAAPNLRDDQVNHRLWQCLTEDPCFRGGRLREILY